MNTQTTDIFPRRLRQARMMRGLSMEKLSKSLDMPISRQAINKYEKGQMMPDSRILIALANALNMKVDFFFRPFTIGIDKVEFRKKSGFTEKMVRIVNERAREELERYLEIEQIVGAQAEFNLPPKVVRNSEQAREFAREIRQILALGSDGISNVIEVLEDNGVKVIEITEDKGLEGLSGLANGDIPIIVVNRNLSPERKRFTALHELAHLLIYVPAEDKDKSTESICNAFASEMLLPTEVLKTNLGNRRHDISLSELTDIQRRFGISVDDIMAAMQELGVISDNRYNVFQKKKSVMADFRSLVEKSRIEPEKSRRFERMVYRALADEIITTSKAAALLNTSPNIVRNNLQLV